MMHKHLPVVLMWLCAVSADAQLTFEQHTLAHVAADSETSHTATFSFTNEGSTRVSILGVDASCGCTTASLDKTEYDPGETGVITARFEYGKRVGVQRKAVTVRTDDAQNPDIRLELVVTISEIVKIRPSIVVWRPGHLGDRSITLESADDRPLKILQLRSDNPEIRTALSPLREGRSYRITLSPPPDVSEPAKHRILIVTNRQGARAEEIELWAYILRPKAKATSERRRESSIRRRR